MIAVVQCVRTPHSEDICQSFSLPKVIYMGLSETLPMRFLTFDDKLQKWQLSADMRI
jgi:hypothetical protein